MPPVRIFGNDRYGPISYYPNMAAAPRHDWYLKAWLKTLHVSQAHLVKETGLKKATVSELVNGKQRYNRDILNDIATALHLRPHELLMHPSEAMALRRVRESAVVIAADNAPEIDAAEGEAAAFG
jgi:transcriptional regulator with XRE-family HTH domain